jgi:tRNA threonylcarbamoyl adenosine modification protein (Sua5/YciO/YrdC/YwlC family)
MIISVLLNRIEYLQLRMGILLHINSKKPQSDAIDKVVACLKDGGVVIYPTDTVYGMGADITQKAAIEKVCKLRSINPEKNNLSIICHDLSHLSDYCKPINNHTFRIMKRCLPGPFTFILEGNNQLPKLFKGRKEVGIRVPNNFIIREVIKSLGSPMMSTSIHDDDELIDYSTDPNLIFEKFQNLVDIVIAGEYGGILPSTVVDFTKQPFEIIREGLGDLALLE